MAFIFCLILTGCKTNETKEGNDSSVVKQPDKPNVIFILADDFGAHDLSSTGSAYYETPHLDRIAREGIVFTNGYAASRVCSPSRASIMTGQFTARHGITDWIGAPVGEDWRNTGRHNKLLPPEYKHELPKENFTLAEALQQINYNTFFAGKWHLGGDGSLPEDHGFDINKGGYHAGGPYTGGYFSPFNNPMMKDYEYEKGTSLSMKLANETVEFIKNNQEEPFFAFLSFYAVHAPIQTSQQKWKKYRDKAEEMGIADTGYKMGHFLPIRQVQDNPVYAGLVETMDDAVGLLLDSLDEMGLAKNTVVIFTSDNGGVSSGDNFATSNLPLRGGKGYQYEGGIREPFFIKVPWMEPRIIDEPVIGTDFYPTILDLVGGKLLPDEHKDGISLLPLLEGKSISERPLVWHYPHYGNQGGEPSSIIRKGNWKLIHYYEDGHKELYDLSKDPEEKYNLVDENIRIAEELHNELFDYLKSVAAKYPREDPEYNSELERQYLQKVKEIKMPQLEKERMELLSPDFDPNNNWWGSQPE